MLKAGDKAPEYLGKDESGKELSINNFAGICGYCSLRSYGGYFSVGNKNIEHSFKRICRRNDFCAGN